ncbi:hypothetical protein HS125_11410 [bacterium]|nr:hypothetical protein [bacterium]
MKFLRPSALMVVALLLFSCWPGAASLMERGSWCARIPLDGFRGGIMSMPGPEKVPWTHRAVLGDAPQSYWIGALPLGLPVAHALNQDGSNLPGEYCGVHQSACFLHHPAAIHRIIEPINDATTTPPGDISLQVGRGTGARRLDAALVSLAQQHLRFVHLLQEKPWERLIDEALERRDDVYTVPQRIP